MTLLICLIIAGIAAAAYDELDEEDANDYVISMKGWTATGRKGESQKDSKKNGHF